MAGPEVHLGIPLARVSGSMDVRLVDGRDRWMAEDRSAPTAEGEVEIRFDAGEAARLAASLLHYAKAHQLTV